MSFGQTRPKRCLSIMHSTTFEENRTQHINTNTSTPTVKHCGTAVMFWACFAATGPHGHLEHELLCIPKYSSVKYKAICPTAKIGSLIPSTLANGEWLKKKIIKVLHWPSQRLEMKCFDGTLRERCLTRTCGQTNAPQTSMN